MSAQLSSVVLALSCVVSAFGADVVVCESDARGEKRQAADELKIHLALLNGGVAPEESAAPVTGKVNFILARPEAAAEPEGRRSYYRIAGDNVWFWGGAKDNYPGTLFAVYTFLKDELGFVWAYPGDDGIVVPAKGRAALPARKEGTFTPSLYLGRMRLPGFNSYFAARLPITKDINPVPMALRWTETSAKARTSDIGRWYQRQRNLPEQVIKYGHAFTKWQERFGTTHPEYFSLDERGQRVHPGYAYRETLCVSNPKVIDQIIADWQAEGAGPFINCCENDGSGFCRCANCRALDADLPGEDFLTTKTDRYLNFYNRVCERARLIRPDVMCSAYIYSFYRFLPRRERVKHPENMVFGFVPSILDDYQKMVREWQGVGMKNFFLRPNFHTDYGSLPRGIEKRVWEVQHFCRQSGMIGVDYDAYPGRFTMLPENYVAVRTISDAAVSFETLMDEFCSAYGEAAGAVNAYYARIRERGERMRADVSGQAGKFLDDSQLVLYALRMHSEKDLLDDLKLLITASVSSGVTSPAARQRLDELIIRAEEYVYVYRFMAAVNNPDEMRKFGRALLAYRIAHKDVLRDYYPNLMNSRYKGTEGHVWKLCPDVLAEFGGWTKRSSRTAEEF